MIRCLVIFLVVCSSCQSAVAVEMSEAFKEKVEHFLELVKAKEKFQLGQLEGFKAGLEMSPVPLPPEKKQQIIEVGQQVMGEVMSWDKVKPEMVTIYGRVYTEGEIDAVNEALQNPTLQMMILKELDVLGPSIRMGMKYGKEMTPILMQRMQNFQ